MNFNELLSNATQNEQMAVFGNLISARYAEKKFAETNLGKGQLGEYFKITQTFDEALEAAERAFPHIHSGMLECVAETWVEELTGYVSRATAFEYIDVTAVQGLLEINIDEAQIKELGSDYAVEFKDGTECSLFANLQALKLLGRDLNVIGHSVLGFYATEHREMAHIVDSFVQYSLDNLESALKHKAPHLLAV